MKQETNLAFGVVPLLVEVINGELGAILKPQTTTHSGEEHYQPSAVFDGEPGVIKFHDHFLPTDTRSLEMMKIPEDMFSKSHGKKNLTIS